MSYGHPRPTNGDPLKDYPVKLGNLIDAADRRLKGNLLDNGAFLDPCWQRGTSIAVTGAKTYTADRWALYRSGFALGATASRQTGGQAQYCARVQRDNLNALTANITFVQNIETLNCIPLRGLPVRLAFRARKGSGFTGVSDILSATINTGTGTDEANDFAYTGLVSTSESKTLTTSFQQFDMAALTIPSNANEITVSFGYGPAGTAGANDYFEIEEVQLVVGDYYGNFPYKGIAEEIANCKRHCRKEDFRIPATTAVSERIGMRAIPTISGGGAGYTSTGTTKDAIVHFQTTGAVATLTLTADI